MSIAISKQRRQLPGVFVLIVHVREQHVLISDPPPCLVEIVVGSFEDLCETGLVVDRNDAIDDTFYQIVLFCSILENLLLFH